MYSHYYRLLIYLLLNCNNVGLCQTFGKAPVVFLSVDGNLLSQAFLCISRKRTLLVGAADVSSGLGLEFASPAM
jgi:hypothetical protein